MKAGAEVGRETELALVGRSLRAKPFERAKAGADACRLVLTRREPPGRDHFVADIFVNLAAGFGNGERDIANELIEQVEKAELA